MATSKVRNIHDVLNGVAVFAGTHIPIQTLLDCLLAGDTIEGFLERYPSVSREQAFAILTLTTVEPMASPDHRDGKKDIWDKLGALSTLVSSILLGAVGLWATNAYNNNALHVQELYNNNALHVQELKNSQDHELAVNQQLADLYKYVSSTQSNERSFGYFMFKQLHYEALALELIKQTKDPAGLGAAVNAAASSDPHIANIGRNIVSSAIIRRWLLGAAANGEAPTLSNSNVERLTAWFKLNAPSLYDSVPLEVFLDGNSPNLEALRVKAIKDLGIAPLICGVFTKTEIPDGEEDDVVKMYMAQSGQPVVTKSRQSNRKWTVRAEFKNC